MAAYPRGCMSEFCGMILCDGCKSRDNLVAYYRAQGGAQAVEKYEAGQASLREQKASKSGAFVFLRDESKGGV